MSRVAMVAILFASQAGATQSPEDNVQWRLSQEYRMLLL